VDLSERIEKLFDEHIRTSSYAKEVLAEPLNSAARAIVQGLLSGGKVLTCGNGGSAAQAQHFSTKMLCHFERERPGLPAIALTADTPAITAIGDSLDFKEVFAKQVGALGHPGDLLLAISADGLSRNIWRAVEIAHQRQLQVIALTGYDGGELSRLLNDQDIEIRVPSESTARIHETHLLVIHCLCDLIDAQLLGN
jgi:D-sedoheptulose 7-phosphate isomerase